MKIFFFNFPSKKPFAWFYFFIVFIVFLWLQYYVQYNLSSISKIPFVNSIIAVILFFFFILFIIQIIVNLSKLQLLMEELRNKKEILRKKIMINLLLALIANLTSLFVFNYIMNILSSK